MNDILSQETTTDSGLVDTILTETFSSTFHTKIDIFDVSYDVSGEYHNKTIKNDPSQLYERKSLRLSLSGFPIGDNMFGLYALFERDGKLDIHRISVHKRGDDIYRNRTKLQELFDTLIRPQLERKVPAYISDMFKP